MSTWDELARAEGEKELARRSETMWRTEGEHLDYSWCQGFKRGFTDGAAWQRDELLTDDVIERAARALYAEDVNESTDTPWPDYDSPKNVGRPLYEERARNALLAAIGDQS